VHNCTSEGVYPALVHLGAVSAPNCTLAPPTATSVHPGTLGYTSLLARPGWKIEPSSTRTAELTSEVAGTNVVRQFALTPASRRPVGLIPTPGRSPACG
jgi:hypothetical protein